MSLLPKTKEEFSQKDYWDRFFKKRGNKAFEWYGEYSELSVLIFKYVKLQDNILIVGCGNSLFGQELFDVGFRNVTNIDISKVAIDQMNSQKKQNRPGLKYIQMDALNTSFEEESFNVIIDKGTLDALMPNQDPDTVEKVKQYFKEMQRLLRNCGRYVCVSLLQEHILRELLNYFPSNNWMFRVVRCHKSEMKSVENGENPLPVFMVVCTKFKSLPRQILEVNLGTEEEVMWKCGSTEEVMSLVSSVQKASFVCSGLQKSSIGDDSEVVLDLYEQTSPEQPRFSVYVVEQNVCSDVKKGSYAVLIVPEGRESEWLFSSKAGRQHLIAKTKQNRLAVVTMHRGQKYQSLEAVKKELEGVVCNLAPSTLTSSKIDFLTLGADLGTRTVVHQGTSQFSGGYVIEDVEHEDGQKFRRLFYLNSQLVVQSEARLKTVKSKRGKKRNVVDLCSLTCQHHVYMSVAACLSEKSKVVVLGLGGGGLCSFLRKFLPGTEVSAVEIDPEMLEIARRWFDFAPDDKLKAHIQDGLDFIRDMRKNGQSVDALLCDVDSKNTEIGMSCPPKEFLSDDILKTVSTSLSTTGVFVVNVVVRDDALRPTVLSGFKRHFEHVFSYKLQEDLNEVFICSNVDQPAEVLVDGLRNGVDSINKFFKSHQQDEVDCEEFVRSLKVN